LNQYANARWPDHLPEVLTSVMKRSLASTGQFSVIEASDRKVGGGWLVKLEVQRFYGLQNASGDTSSVVIQMSASIECKGMNRSYTLTDSNPVADQRLSAVVAAHQRGLDEITRRLLEKISEACS